MRSHPKGWALSVLFLHGDSMAFKEYMKKRHMSGSKSGLCDSDGNLIEKSEPKEKKADKKMAKKEKKRSYLDV